MSVTRAGGRALLLLVVATRHPSGQRDGLQRGGIALSHAWQAFPCGVGPATLLTLCR